MFEKYKFFKKELAKKKYILYNDGWDNYFVGEFTGDFHTTEVANCKFEYAYIKLATESCDFVGLDKKALPEIKPIKINLINLKSYTSFISKKKFDKKMALWEDLIKQEWTGDYFLTQFVGVSGKHYKRCGDTYGEDFKWVIPVKCIETGEKTEIKYGENVDNFRIVDDLELCEAEKNTAIKKEKVSKETVEKALTDFKNNAITNDEFIYKICRYFDKSDSVYLAEIDNIKNYLDDYIDTWINNGDFTESDIKEVLKSKAYKDLVKKAKVCMTAQEFVSKAHELIKETKSL